jgi:hypothetical protein
LLPRPASTVTPYQASAPAQRTPDGMRRTVHQLEARRAAISRAASSRTARRYKAAGKIVRENAAYA